MTIFFKNFAGRSTPLSKVPRRKMKQKREMENELTIILGWERERERERENRKKKINKRSSFYQTRYYVLFIRVLKKNILIRLLIKRMKVLLVYLFFLLYLTFYCLLYFYYIMVIYHFQKYFYEDRYGLKLVENLCLLLFIS